MPDAIRILHYRYTIPSNNGSLHVAGSRTIVISAREYLYGRLLLLSTRMCARYLEISKCPPESTNRLPSAFRNFASSARGGRRFVLFRCARRTDRLAARSEKGNAPPTLFRALSKEPPIIAPRFTQATRFPSHLSCKLQRSHGHWHNRLSLVARAWLYGNITERCYSLKHGLAAGPGHHLPGRVLFI